MEKKALTLGLLVAALTLTACEKKKDVNYFFEHPEETAKAIKECEEKATDAINISIDELEKLKGDEYCKAVVLGFRAIEYGDPKQAILAEEEFGWDAVLDEQIRSEKREAIKDRFKWYIKHTDELTKVMNECETKAKEVPLEQIDNIKDDIECRAAYFAKDAASGPLILDVEIYLRNEQKEGWASRVRQIVSDR